MLLANTLACMTLFSMLYKVVLPFWSVDETRVCEHSYEFEQHFHVVLFIIQYKVVLTFKSVRETLVCDHLNESYFEQYFHDFITKCLCQICIDLFDWITC